MRREGVLYDVGSVLWVRLASSRRPTVKDPQWIRTSQQGWVYRTPTWVASSDAATMTEAVPSR
jgi:hypothetical protein